MTIKDNDITLPSGRLSSDSASIRLESPAPQQIRLFLDVLGEQSWFISLASFYVTAGYAISSLYDYPFSLFLYSKIQIAIYLNLIVAFFVFQVARAVYKHRPERPLQFVWNDFKQNRALPKRLLHALPPLLLLPLALSAFTSLKFLIPLIQPFAWDYDLTWLDAAVHGGAHPWELLQPLIGYPRVTVWIDYLYRFPWFWMLILLKFWLIFTSDPQRLRFLVTFLLCWLLLGNVAATLLSSGGPVYYGNFVSGPDPFAPLISYLDSVGESYQMYVRTSQEFLLQAHLSRDLAPGTGISAMPSMHISMGFFLVLIAWRYHWTLRAGAVAYLIVLEIGSVHLGWHYAIDGYVSIIGTYLIWWAVGRALQWRDSRSTASAPQP